MCNTHFNASEAGRDGLDDTHKIHIYNVCISLNRILGEFNTHTCGGGGGGAAAAAA